ncbi:MAG TPA: hypothetical protein VEK57_00870 [Thermoanaerobaculia bacterium]|nr:hypothetical protein [Thermoanaerobaculia bacterium]
MPNPTPDQIRRIFLSPRPHVTLMTAADLLGMTLKDLKKDIDDGVIVATSTPLGVRISREEMITAAMRLWEQTVIEDVLGDDAAAVLPEAIRLVLLRVRVPRYQRDMLVALAQRHGTSVDEILTRELEDVACAHAEELAGAVPSLAIGLGTGSDGGAGWPNLHQ